VRCEHEHDDGAYVLGALSPAERAAYERHLATCSFCREAVAEIAVLPGLLGRLDPADFAKLLDPTLSAPAPTPINRTPGLVTAAQTTRRRERKKVRVRVLSTALAAAVVALIVGVGAVFLMDGGPPETPLPPGEIVAMTPVSDTVPLSARLSIADVNGGSKINLICSYPRNSPGLKPYTVRLVAYGPDDETDQLGSWVASPGKEFTMPGVTHLSSSNLSRLELVRNDGTTLLAYDVP
jgi:Putative zinc-finger